MKRIELTSRSLVAVLEPGSSFAGTLAEIVFAADRSYMAEGSFEGDNRPPAEMTLTDANFGPYPMSNNLTRLETRFLGHEDCVSQLESRKGERIEAHEASELGPCHIRVR